MISAEVRSSHAFGGDRFNHQNGINAATAAARNHALVEKMAEAVIAKAQAIADATVR